MSYIAQLAEYNERLKVENESLRAAASRVTRHFLAGENVENVYSQGLYEDCVALRDALDALTTGGSAASEMEAR